MSFYVLLASGISALIGVTASVTSAVIALVRSRQSEDPNEKRSLLVASYFIGFSIVFAILCIISGLTLVSTKGCKKKSKLFFIIAFIALALALIIGLVIIAVFRTRAAREGRNDVATALNAAIYLPIVSLGLYILSFILLYVALGRKLKRLNKVLNNFFGSVVAAKIIVFLGKFSKGVNRAF